jgi:N-carbamoyl-L-amino-acid hydrolase
VTGTTEATATTGRINADRLMSRIMELAEVGKIDGGGCSRLALTDDDRAGRDLVIRWMRDLGLEIRTDDIGNVVGTWAVGNGSAVMTGSHIDTVRTGGKYDGNYGVLAGLEVIHTCLDLGITPDRPISVAFFTNEEGARFAPDMLGSLVYVGGMPVAEAHDIVAIDGARLGDELRRIDALGTSPTPGESPFAFVELHIEQGPVLESRATTIGAVTGVQGISWTELTITGQSNHAGTTPMALRHDPLLVAARIATFLRDLASRYGGNQVCTVGKLDVHPNLVNVVAARATMTLDVRNTDEDVLRRAESEIREHWQTLARTEGVSISERRLARFEPVVFDERVVAMVHRVASEHGHTVIELPSGAGHDAQMLARVCPTAMIFVPSHKGISHNPAEHTDRADLVAGADVLFDVMLRLASMTDHADLDAYA